MNRDRPSAEEVQARVDELRRQIDHHDYLYYVWRRRTRNW
jgi:hypothetical protein